MAGAPFSVPADPYEGPFDGPVARDRVALIVIGMQGGVFGATAASEAAIAGITPG